MQKPISPKMHGMIDYTMGLALPFMPRLFHFKSKKDRRKAQMLACGIATMTGIVAMLTDWNEAKELRAELGATRSTRAAA